MTMLLGGRAAEEIVFGAVTTGASDDLTAWPRSRARWSTSTRWAPRSPRARSRRRAARCPTARASCATRSSSTSPTRRMRAAARLIVEHRDKLDELARALLRNEVLERADIDRIMAGVPRVQRARRPACASWPPRRPPSERRHRPRARRREARRSTARGRARADLAVDVELGAAAAGRPRPRGRGGARPRAARRSCRAAGPRRGGRARAASRPGRTATSSTPSCGIGRADAPSRRRRRRSRRR